MLAALSSPLSMNLVAVGNLRRAKQRMLGKKGKSGIRSVLQRPLSSMTTLVACRALSLSSYTPLASPYCISKVRGNVNQLAHCWGKAL